MKQIAVFLSVFLASITLNGQITNGSFENGSNPDLSNWQWTCFADSDTTTPPGGENWSIKVSGGNTQGCFPGYAYQKLPTITNGQTFFLTAWAFAQLSPSVGLYFGKINNGIITLQSGDTTSSTNWTPLSIQSSFSLSSGDTAIVVLDGGLIGGPAQGYGFFDLISLEHISGINSIEQKHSLTLYPNPFINQTTLKTEDKLHNATLTMTNTLGQTVKQIRNIYGQKVMIERDNLSSGLYFVHFTENDRIIAKIKASIVD